MDDLASVAGEVCSAGGDGFTAGNVTFVQVYEAGHMVPFDQPEGIEPGKTKCINPDCQTPAKQWILFGRSY